ncbi:MAG: 3'(2'),5'-bisphosphate nucleotidase CysQ [Bacteroidales bacterium]|nr:3'(2'),5'-bisphosphate nucleotidase CysQ [Bacteroidales bacterium]
MNRRDLPETLAPLILKAIPGALRAGDAILTVYKESDLGIEIKPDNTPLTRADRSAHLIISEALSSTGLPMISEEGQDIPYTERQKWETFWLVDPLDGTREFIKRNGEFTVNIALVHAHYPVAGIVYAPVCGELYLGLGALGAWKVNAPLHVSAEDWFDGTWMQAARRLPFPVDARPFTVVASRSHMNQETQEFIDDLRSRMPSLAVANRGSSLKTCLIAEGAADMYPRFGPTMEWDTAASQAVAEAAGITVIEAVTGRRLTYNKENLLNPWFIVFDPKSTDQSSLLAQIK